MSEREFDYKQIEYPSAGATYCNDEYGVYGYGKYPSYSVLAGQVRRCFLESYETLEEAKKAHPDAVVSEGSGYVPVSVNHLPDEEDW